PLVLGNLWDVTDRDIDRYAEALLQGWLRAGSGAPLLRYVARARLAPKLKSLIGAAPVVYGLPEVEFLSSSIAQLKVVQTKYVEAKDCLAVLHKSNEGKDLLVPLTSSMYVPGKLLDVERVLLDVGTGYYVEKTADDARDFFKRKIDFLTKQMEKIQPALQEKHAMKQAVGKPEDPAADGAGGRAGRDHQGVAFGLAARGGPRNPAPCSAPGSRDSRSRNPLPVLRQLNRCNPFVAAC
ncbi:PREDICTED: prefoldin subunit 5, partial [Tinamus guttatus]|uniref:prefoldin subunit 5 n=1 Tax=Tinamus guttatus TaxID=94827 RepID=UPI00052F398E